MSWLYSAPVEPSYPDEATPTTLEDYHLLREKMFVEMEELKQSGWEAVDQGVEGVDFYKKMVPGWPVEMLRIESEVAGTPEEVSAFHDTCTMEERATFDKQLRTQDVIEDLGDIKIIYAIFNGVFPVSDRDFVAFRGYKTLSDGTCINLGHTINYAKRPIQASPVRAKGKVAIYHTPVPGNPFRCRMTKLVLTDPMGNIPKYLLALAHKHVALSQLLLGRILETKFGGERSLPLSVQPSLPVSNDVRELKTAVPEVENSEEFYSFHEDEDFFTVTECPELTQNTNIASSTSPSSRTEREISQKSTKAKNNNKSELSEELAVISNSLATLHKSINDLQQQLVSIQGPPKNSLVASKNGNNWIWKWIISFGWPIFIVFVYHVFKKRFLKKNTSWLL